MKVIYSFLGAFLLVSLSAALNNPLNNEMFFLIGLFSIWMVVTYKFDKVIELPWMIFPLFAYLLLYLGLMINGQKTPYEFHWFVVSILFFLIFVVFVDINRKWALVNIFENALLILAIVACILNTREIVSWYSLWAQLSGEIFVLPPSVLRISGTFFGHPNTFAGFLNIVCPLVFLRLTLSNERKRKFAWGGLLLWFLIMLFFTASRAGWIAGIIGLLVIILIKYWKRFKIFFNKCITFTFTKRELFSLLSYSMIGLFVTGILIFVLISQIRATGRNPFGSSGRNAVWSISEEMVVGSPILGNGAGSFPGLYASYMLHRSDLPNFQIHAHNVWIHIAVETGIIGVFLALLALGLFLKSHLQAYSIPTNTKNKQQLAVYSSIIISILIFNLFDFPIASIEYIYAICVILIGALALSFVPASEFLVVKRKYIYPIVVFALIGLVLLVTNLKAGGALYKTGLDAARMGNWFEARDNFCEAIAQNKGNAIYYFQCSAANANIAYLYNDPIALSEAIKWQKEGITLDPNWPINYVNLAILEWEQGNFKSALENMNLASKNFASNEYIPYPVISLLYGWMAEQLGYEQEAINAYSKALDEDRLIAVSNISDNSNLLKYVVEQKGERYQGDLWHGFQALETGSFDTANEKVTSANQKSPNGLTYALLALVNQNMGNESIAEDYLQKALYFSKSARVLSIAGHVARQRGQDELASEYLVQAYNKLFEDPNSRYYYSVMYRYEIYLLIFSPYTRNDLRIFNFLTEDYIWLADYLEQNDQSDNHSNIIKWVEKNFPDNNPKN